MSLDELAETATRRFGNIITRRSLLGRTALAITVVGAGGLAAEASPALAAGCNGCSNCGDSATCGCNVGDGCPGGTCAGGAWLMCSSLCIFSYTRYQDCLSKTCTPYCNCQGRPGCYYTTPYGSCRGTSRVYCRSITCVHGPC
jgi:hypothetical protein